MQTLAERMKSYEQNISYLLDSDLPIIARLDGRAFHSFCANLEKPYDVNFSMLMREVTAYLLDESGAKIAYTQSDEITLVFYKTNDNSQLFFGGKLQKIVSILASMATLKFNQLLPKFLLGKSHLSPMFDCRAFNVPSKAEVVNNLVWREQDATRNSVSMLAQAHFSHNQLHNKDSVEMKAMLNDIGTSWFEQPEWFKYGTYFYKTKVLEKFSTSELVVLPEKHHARINPDLMIERNELAVQYFNPDFSFEERMRCLFGDS